MMRHTKIGATIGPSCDDAATITALIKAGVNFARLNFSYGTYDEYRHLIGLIRTIEKQTGEPVAIMQDLQGPKIRLGTLPEAGLTVAAGEEVSLNTALADYSLAEKKELPLIYRGLEDFVKPGERIMIDDGRLEFKITAIRSALIVAEVIQGGIALSHKGLNFPDSTLFAIPALSQKDQADVKFGVEMGVDIISLSFVKRAQDILDLRFLIKLHEEERGIKAEQPIRLMAKIERHEAVDNMKEIVEAADAIMVARGDLGLEMPTAELPLIQKKIIDAVNTAGKPVIVATQLLDSMQHSRRPTRAEATDVANAVIDHADGLLLTNETATGEYPVLAVETMNEIIVATERSSYDDTNLPATHRGGTSVEKAVSEVSRMLAEEVKARLILAASFSGETGRMISQVRPNLPILVATADERVQRQLNISWGVQAFLLPACRSIEELVERSVNYIKQHKLAKLGDKMIIVAGEPVGQSGNVNLVEVREIK